ncbi:hypothetical protein N7493_006360, partial [Penicillium malachiteum]
NPAEEDYAGNLKNIRNDPAPQLRIYTSEQDMYHTSADQPYTSLTYSYQCHGSQLKCHRSVPPLILASILSHTSDFCHLGINSTTWYPNPYSTPSIRQRRVHAHLYAEAAFSEVDNEIDGISATCSHPRTDGSMEMDSHLKAQLGPIIALVLLSVYEYCRRGNISRMRSRANQAVTAAMDLSLHHLGPGATETQLRTWWSAMLVLYLSSIDQQVSPIISLNDPRITTPFPELGNATEVFCALPWNLQLEAEKSILMISERYAMFLEKYCDLTAIKDKAEGIADLGLTSTGDFAASFPFTEQESSVMCLKSSLVIARALENLPLRSAPTPYILPYFVCAAMQSAYVLLTSYYRIRAALESGHLSLYYYLLNCPEPDSETQDAERLIRELRQGMEPIIGALKLAQMFEGVGGMSQEILIAYQAAILID